MNLTIKNTISDVMLLKCIFHLMDTFTSILFITTNEFVRQFGLNDQYCFLSLLSNSGKMSITLTESTDGKRLSHLSERCPSTLSNTNVHKGLSDFYDKGMFFFNVF